MRFANKQKPDFLTFGKVLNIMDRHSGYSYIIPRTGEIDAAVVIDIFEKLIKPTMGLPFSLVSNPDVLFMSTEFQDWLCKTGIRQKVFTTYHSETDGEIERKNRELTEMIAGHQLEGTD